MTFAIGDEVEIDTRYTVQSFIGGPINDGWMPGTIVATPEGYALPAGSVLVELDGDVSGNLFEMPDDPKMVRPAGELTETFRRLGMFGAVVDATLPRKELGQ